MGNSPPTRISAGKTHEKSSGAFWKDSGGPELGWVAFLLVTWRSGRAEIHGSGCSPGDCAGIQSVKSA
jgi:hypothetical protein